MASFVQDVFNEISLERDPDLWQCADDTKMSKRIKFLSGFEETKFKKHLRTGCNPALEKNSKLCQAFQMKASKTDESEKKIALMNKYDQFLQYQT